MKLLISDFDKTLYNSDYKRNIKKVNEFVEVGNKFIIASGRNYSLLKKEIKKDNINYEYLICNDGALIVDSSDNEIYRADIPKKLAEQLYKFLKEKKVENLLIDDGFNYYEEIIDNNNSIMFSVIDNCHVLEEILIKFPDIVGYRTKKWVILTSGLINKKTGIEVVLKKLKINRENVFTVGDGINDYHMIKEFNGYFIEGESIPILKKIAVDSVNSVADLIDKIIWLCILIVI